MTINVAKLVSLALACAAMSFAALAADSTPAKDGKDKQKVQKTVVVRSGDDEEPQVFEFNSDDDGEGSPRFAYAMLHGKGGYLGVGLTDLTPELRAHFGVPDDAGVMVSHIEPDSPAAKAGLKVGDIITGAGGKKIKGSGSLTSVIRKMKEGEAAPLEVWRDRKVQTITANVIVKERKQVELPPMTIDGTPIPGFDPERMKEITERMTQKFNSPEFQKKLEHQAELEQKMKELDKRMKELEQKLKDKSS